MNRRISEKWFTGLESQTRSAQPNLSKADEYVTLLKAWVKQTEQVVAAHPGASLAVAAAAGFLIGWWMKRK